MCETGRDAGRRTRGRAAGGNLARRRTGVTLADGLHSRHDPDQGRLRTRLKIGGKTLAFKGGSCDRSAQYVSVNIGTVVLGTLANKPDYFGLDVGRMLGAGVPAPRDGTYKGSAVAVDYGGKGYAVRADQIDVTLTGNRSKGTFTATLLLGGSLSGSFSC